MKLVQEPELLEAFRAGDPQALATVYLHYAPMLYQFLGKGFSFTSQERWFRVSPLQDPLQQESYVQETFVRAFDPKARQRYDGERPYLPYLQRICRNLVLEDRRKDQRLVWEEPTEVVQQPDGRPSAQKSLEDAQLQEQLQSFLAGCEEREAQVFRALFEHGDSQMQAATRLQLSRMQIRTSLKRLRREMLSFFQDSGYLQRLFAQQRHGVGSGAGSFDPLSTLLWLTAGASSVPWEMIS